MPTRSLAAFLLIGIVDLISTAWLHAQGMIVELNPLMRASLAYGEWFFVIVKGTTLLALWIVMVLHAQKDVKFVHNVCRVGAAAYVGLWVVWFLIGQYGPHAAPLGLLTR